MRRRDLGFAVATGAFLVAYNNLAGRDRWHRQHYVLVNLGASAVLLTAATASGLTAADLGLGQGSGWWRPGRLAAGLAAGIGAGWILVAASPAAGRVLDDKRIASFGGREVAYQAVIRIPVGTVLWEEIAFRGVLQAALRRVAPERTAIGINAAVFGLWHLRPTIEALRANDLAADRRQAVTRGVAGSAAMAGAGVLLSWLRERSGRLSAPALLHVTANSGAIVAAGVSARRPGHPAIAR